MQSPWTHLYCLRGVFVPIFLFGMCVLWRGGFRRIRPRFFFVVQRKKFGRLCLNAGMAGRLVGEAWLEFCGRVGVQYFYGLYYNRMIMAVDVSKKRKPNWGGCVVRSEVLWVYRDVLSRFSRRVLQIMRTRRSALMSKLNQPYVLRPNSLSLSMMNTSELPASIIL